MHVRYRMFLFVLTLVAVSAQPLPTSAQSYSGEVSKKSPMPQKDMEVIAPLTFDELKRFVRDWRRYSRWLQGDGKKFSAVAYLDAVEQVDYPQEVVNWMDQHGWATDRFFLLERRIRETLSALKKEEKRTSFTEHMQLQLNTLEEDETKSEKEKKALRQQYLRSIQNVVQTMDYVPPVSPEEMELIKLNRKALETVMEP